MISVIIPFFNESESIPLLLKRLTDRLGKIGEKYEVVLIDDGSTDASPSDFRSKIDKAVGKNGQEMIMFFSHRKRFGKGKALQTGLERSKGDIIVFMDGDLQDDPDDLPKFMSKINEGYEMVNGIRVNRQDNLLIKIYSGLAAIFLRNFLHSPFKDINCGFKIFKRKILNEVVLYGNNFRFLPLAAYYQGFKVTEVPVNNQKRQFGKSKFGTKKLVGGIFDTMTAYFIYQFAETPLHFFGPVGGIMLIVGLLISILLTIQRIFFGMLLYRRPLLFLGILSIIVGVQIVMTGIVGELIVYMNKKKSS